MSDTVKRWLIGHFDAGHRQASPNSMVDFPDLVAAPGGTAGPAEIRKSTRAGRANVGVIDAALW